MEHLYNLYFCKHLQKEIITFVRARELKAMRYFCKTFKNSVFHELQGRQLYQTTRDHVCNIACMQQIPDSFPSSPSHLKFVYAYSVRGSERFLMYLLQEIKETQRLKLENINGWDQESRLNAALCQHTFILPFCQPGQDERQ